MTPVYIVSALILIGVALYWRRLEKQPGIDPSQVCPCCGWPRNRCHCLAAPTCTGHGAAV